MMQEELEWGNKKSFKELLSFNKGSIPTTLSFLVDHKVIVLFDKISDDKVVHFLTQEQIKHPELSNYLTKEANYVSVDWNALQADSVLCGAIMVGFIALGATAVWD